MRMSPWPIKSLDVNIIENFWREMARNAYCGYEQFEITDEQKAAMAKVYEELPTDYMLKLYHRLKRRRWLLLISKETPQSIDICALLKDH